MQCIVSNTSMYKSKHVLKYTINTIIWGMENRNCPFVSDVYFILNYHDKHSIYFTVSLHGGQNSI